MAWTQEEIENYRQVDNSQLTLLYANAGVLRKNPEEKARYLAEDFLELIMTDHGFVMKEASEEGRAAALNMLEEMAIHKLKN